LVRRPHDAFLRANASLSRRTSGFISSLPIAESAELWTDLVGKRVHLVPLGRTTELARRQKAADLKAHYSIRGPWRSFTSNRSEFLSSLRLRIRREDSNFVVTVDGAIAVANTIAYFSELIDPISIFLGLTRRDLMSQALRSFFLGRGRNRNAGIGNRFSKDMTGLVQSGWTR
jgi:hypothetical protein